MRKVDDAEPLALYVYKTMVDPFAGRITFFKVVSGVREERCHGGELHAQASRSGWSHLSVMQGRQGDRGAELHAGDLGAVAKLRDTLTGDTLGAKGHDMLIEPVPVPEPAMTYAIEPKSRADEDKLAPALHKLMEEDLLLRFYPRSADQRISGRRRGTAAHRGGRVAAAARAIIPRSR